MPLFLVTYRLGRVETIEADDVFTIGAHVVFVDYRVVLLSAREVVTRRLRRVDVSAVVRL